jgi:transcriptional regulator with XRE-family HTH domain
VSPTIPLVIEEAFSRDFRRRRIEGGLSQAAVADQLRERFGLTLDPTSITRLEAGERRLRVNEAYALSAAIGADFVSMLNDALVAQGMDKHFLQREAETYRRRIDDLTAALAYIEQLLADPDYVSMGERRPGELPHA